MTTKRNTLPTRRRSLAVIPAALAIGLLSAVPASAGSFPPTTGYFGNQVIGTQSPVRTMFFKKASSNSVGYNNSRYVATIENLEVGEVNFKVVSNTCDPDGDPPLTGTCEVGVIFAPDTVGFKTSGMRMSRDGHPEGWMRLSGRGITPPPPLPLGIPPITQPSMTPKSHDFGSTIVGTLGSSKEFVFKAGTGPGNPSVQEIALFPSAHYNIISDTCTGKALGKGQTCKLAVRFEPGSLGLKPTSLLVASDQGQVSSSLAGKGVARPKGTLTPG